MEEFGYLLGRGTGTSVQTRSGVTVGPNRALGVSAWWRGCNYLTSSVAGLPIHHFNKAPSGARTKLVEPGWVRKPDTETPWYALIELWMMSLLHKGNAYGYKVRDFDGVVVGLRGLHPDRVKPGQDPDTGMKVFQIDNRTDVGYTTREILHIPGLSYDGIIGLNPIQVHAEALGLVAGADEYAGRYMGNGTHVDSFITTDAVLTDEQANLMKSQWMRMHQGLLNAHEVAVLGGGAKYETITLNPEQAQLLQTRKFGVTEVSRMLSLPPHKLYDLERATFSNIEHQSIEAVTDGVVPWVNRIEAWLNFDPDLTVGTNYLEFQIEGLLRGDTASRYAAYSQATGRPWMTAAEARRLENLPERDGLDDVAIPLNIAAREEAQIDPVSQTVGAPALLMAQIMTINEARADYGLPPTPDGNRILTVEEIQALKAGQQQGGAAA